MVEIFILTGFQHIFGSKNVFLESGTTYYLSLDGDREELAWMLSSNFPYRNRINIRLTPAVVSALGTSGNSSLVQFSTPPSNPSPGDMYFNTVSRRPYVWDGSEWVDLTQSGTTSSSIIPPLEGDIISSGFDNNAQIAPGVITNNDIAATAAISLNKLETNPLNRNNHFGTQLSSTISDFVDRVRQERINEMAIPGGNLNMNNYRLVNLAPAMMDQDAVNYAQALNMIEGITDLNNFVGPLRLDQGGTGITANNAIEALNALQGIGDATNLGGAADGARVYSHKNINTGAVPSVLNFRRVRGGLGIEVFEAGNYIEIGLGSADVLDINTSLGGYPVMIEKGGTGAMEPLGARLNLGVVGNAENTVAPTLAIATVFQEKVGDILRFRSLQEGLGIDLDQNLAIDRIKISVRENDLCLQNLNGALELNSTQVAGQLPISKGGTDAETPLEARNNLAAVGDAISLGGVSILGAPTKDFTGPDPTVLRFKGLVTDPALPLIVLDDSDPNQISIEFDPSQLDISLTTGDLDATTRLAGVVPIASGGTKGTTVGEARVNLGLIYKVQKVLGSTGQSLVPATNPLVLDAGLGYAMNLRGLRPGNGITIEPSLNGHDLLISTNIPDNYDIANIGTGTGTFYYNRIGNTFNFKTLKVGPAGGLIIQNNLQEVVVTPNIANAVNIGTGTTLLAPFTLPGAELRFRSINSLTGSLEDDGIDISTNGNEVLLATHIANISSVGTGFHLHQDLLVGPGNDVKFKTVLTEGLLPGMSIIDTGDELRFQAFLADALSVGIGTSILKTITPITQPGTILEFKSITEGPGISIVELPDEVQINNRVVSVGGFTSILSPTVINPGDAIEFRSLRAGPGIQITTVNPNVIDIASTIPEYLIANVGGGVGQVFRDKVGNTFNLKTLRPAVGDRIRIINEASLITLDIDEANLDINNLGGVPLTIAGGGTGATTIPGIRDNINVVFDVMDAGAAGAAAISIIDSVYNSVGEGKIVELKKLMAGNDILISEVGSDLVIESTAVMTPIPGLNIGTEPGEVFVVGSETTGQYEYKTIGYEAVNPGIEIVNNADSIILQPYIASVNEVAGVGESLINTPVALPIATPNTTVEFKKITAEANTPITVQTVGSVLEVGISQLGAFVDGVAGVETAVGSGIYEYNVNHNLNVTGTQMIVQASTAAGQVAQIISIASGGANTATIRTNSPGPLNFRIIKVGP